MFLSATQGVNSALSLLFFAKAEEQRERKNKRERERKVLPSSSLFQHHQKGNKDKTSSSTSSFLDFRQQRGEEKKLLFIHTFFFWRCEKGEKDPFCSSSVAYFLLLFIYVWEASIIKLCSWLKKRKHPLPLMPKSRENHSCHCKTLGIALLPCFLWFRMTSVHLMFLPNGI